MLRKLIIASAFLAACVWLFAGNIKTVDGVARANIKTLDGVASANLKTLNGVDATTGVSYTLLLSVTGTTVDNTLINYDSSSVYGAYNFTAPSNGTITKISVPIFRTGTPAFSCRAAIFSYSGGTTGSLVGTASEEISMASIPTTETTATEFAGTLSATVSSGTAYAVVLYKSSGTDGFYTNYVSWPIIASGTSTDEIEKSADGSSWTNVQAYRKAKVTIYTTP